MSKEFKKQFKTKKTADETRQFINHTLLNLPALKSAVKKVEWEGNTLHFDSVIGNGKFVIADNLVDVEINLTFAGQMAIGQLEKALDTEIVKLQ
jgi:hypothetical protein